MAGEKLLVAFLILGLLYLRSSTGNLVFEIQPQPLTALYTKVLIFECAALNANIYQWLMDGTDNYLYDSDINSSINNTVENSIKKSILTIRPPQDADKLNYTFVRCIAVSHVPGSTTAQYIESKPALLQVQGKLDAPEINEVFINCPSRTVNVSWNRPKTLPGIPVTEYDVCSSGKNCTRVGNTTVSWTGNFSVAQAYTCEEDTTRIAAVTGEEKGHYAIVNSTFTQGPEFIQAHQIQSEVVFLTNNQTFQIEYQINLDETDACHLPNAYRVKISYANSNQSEITPPLPVELAYNDDDFKQTFSVNIAGENTDAYSVLEPQNCVGSNTSMPVKNRLSHLQSVDLKDNYVTCTFAEGSNAIGCQAVSTCNTSVSGMVESSEVTCLIALSPSVSDVTGSIACGEIIDCLTYDVSVFEVLPDGSTGASAVIKFSNITFLPGSLPTSSHGGLPTPSSSIPPTENSKDTVILISTILGSIFLLCLITVIILFAVLICHQISKQYKTRIIKL